MVAVRTRLAVPLLALLVLLVTVSLAAVPPVAGEVVGHVFDSTGAAVAGARVAAYEPEPSAFLGGARPMWRPRSYADGTAEAIDQAVKALVAEAFDRAAAILRRNRPVLDSAAQELLAKETLSKLDVERISRTVAPEPPVDALTPPSAKRPKLQSAV